MLFVYSDGCRPYIELYQGDEKVRSTLVEYDRMRMFHMSEGKVRAFSPCYIITLYYRSRVHVIQNIKRVKKS